MGMDLIYGYKQNRLRTFSTWLAIVASGFLLRLIFFWRPHWMLYCTHQRCSLEEADHALLVDKYNQYFVEQIHQLHNVPPFDVCYGNKLNYNCSRTNSSPSRRRSSGYDDLNSPQVLLDSGNGFSTAEEKLNYGSLTSRRRLHSSSANDQNLNGGPTPSSTVPVGRKPDPGLESSSESFLGSTDVGRLSSVNFDSPQIAPIKGDSDSNQALVQFMELDHNNDKQSTLDGDDPGNGHQYSVRYFESKKIRYIWSDHDNSFVRLRGLDKDVTFSQLQTLTRGLSKSEQDQRQRLFGENVIHVEVLPYFRILFEEVLGPFYIFQLFSITIWFSDDYYYYATYIVIVSVISLISSTLQIRRNQEQLRDTVESVNLVKVCRGKDLYEEVESSQIVPGDIVVVPTFNSILQFDAVLINGNVIVNESMLTGESVPVTKTPLPLQNYTKLKHDRETYYDEKEHNKHTLYCGTKVLQTRYYGGVYVKALVIRIGFQTSKGELVRSIMFPKPVDFRFNKQIHKFIGVLGALALIGFVYSVFIRAYRGAELHTILVKALDLITIVVPPALPAAMTIGIIYAQSRLKSNKIFCISPRSINISGCINCVCFDKTGTLTEDNLSFNEVVPFIEDKCKFGEPFNEEVMQTNFKQVERDNHILLNNGQYSPLMICLACCHSLTIIEQQIVGDPLDLQMFEATGWVLEEPDVDDENKFDLLAPSVVRPPRRKRRTPTNQEVYMSSTELSSSSTEDELEAVSTSMDAGKRCEKDVGILRQFPFSSSLQRMSVITRQFSGDQYVVYTKGAPEKIASLCDASTIPDDFYEILQRYTRKGFRVLALAYRPLRTGLSYTRMQRASRLDIEKDLKFLGLLTLGNLLKPETLSAITTLNKANIRCVMVTGDNMLTAISVANECQMILEQEKIILLQVENKTGKESENKHRTEVEKKQQQQQQQQDKFKAEANQTNPSDSSISNPFILNVENIQLQAKNEMEPMLNSKLKRNLSRPKLNWHYVNNDSIKEMSSDAFTRLNFDIIGDTRTHLALTGESWEVILNYYPELVDTVCLRGTVFARMAPNQKQQLVEHLQGLQYYVGMCGDGANDSGALRAAHAGISLSDTEASVAAPFTSANANISCVPILISEGRAALVTAFGILKYMALYSLIQFSSVLLLYTLYTNFTDTEFLYEDLFIIATFTALFGRTEPYPLLHDRPPPSSLLSMTQLSSVGIQVVLAIIFQVFALVLLRQYPWYEPHPATYNQELACHDNFVIFAISAFQCISLVIVYSKGRPYRKSIASNYLLTAALIIISIITVIMLTIPGEWDVPLISLEVKNIPLEFRLILICFSGAHFILSMFTEHFIVNHLIFNLSEHIKRKGLK